MNPLLIVLGFCKADAPRAEALIDWMYALNGCKPNGHALLVAGADVHPEMILKCKISAGVAFESFELVQAPANESAEPHFRVNKLVLFAANQVSRNYRAPWLWLEPDCVPLQKGWLETLANAYASQPRRYLGPHLKTTSAGKERSCLGRISIYAPDAVEDLKPWCDSLMPFHLFAGEALSSRSLKSKLIQQTLLQNESDYDKLRPDAVLVHADKTGRLISRERDRLEATPQANGHPPRSVLVEIPVAPKRRGRPPKSIQVAVQTEPVI